jgi:hypothetical protein
MLTVQEAYKIAKEADPASMIDGPKDFGESCGFLVLSFNVFIDDYYILLDKETGNTSDLTAGRGAGRENISMIQNAEDIDIPMMENAEDIDIPMMQNAEDMDIDSLFDKSNNGDDDEEYYCIECAAILNDQSGFDPENGPWTCTECGEELYIDNGNIYPRFRQV